MPARRDQISNRVSNVEVSEVPESGVTMKDQIEVYLSSQKVLCIPGQSVSPDRTESALAVVARGHLRKSIQLRGKPYL